MSKVTVIVHHSRLLGGKFIEPNQPTETDDLSGAAYLVSMGLASYAAEKSSDDKSRLELIADAIEKLNPDDSEQWTTSGKPNVKDLEQVLGFDISATERDQAWALFDEE